MRSRSGFLRPLAWAMLAAETPYVRAMKRTVSPGRTVYATYGPVPLLVAVASATGGGAVEPLDVDGVVVPEGCDGGGAATPEVGETGDVSAPEVGDVAGVAAEGEVGAAATGAFVGAAATVATGVGPAAVGADGPRLNAPCVASTATST